MAVGEPRMTQDIDLIVFIRKISLPIFLSSAKQAGFTVNRQRAMKDVVERGTCTIGFRGVAIDLILASTDLEESAWRRKIRRKIFGRLVNLPSLEDFILLKMIPGRPKDLMDAGNVAVSAGKKLDRKYLRLWAERFCDRAEGMRVMRQLGELGILAGAAGRG